MKARGGGVGFWHANHSVHQSAAGRLPRPPARECLKSHTGTAALAEATQWGAHGSESAGDLRMG